jgi:hypothetical protein
MLKFESQKNKNDSWVHAMKDIQQNTKPKKTFKPINEVVILNTKVLA